MTIQDVDTKALSHFRIKEKGEKRDPTVIDYEIIKLNDGFDSNLNQKLIEQSDKLKQSGGKHRRRYTDSSSSSSSSSSDYDDYSRSFNLPITRFVYFSLPYQKLHINGLTPVDISRIFLPMFSLPINPTLEIRFDLYRY